MACYYLSEGDPGTLPLNPLHVVDGSASELRLMSENLLHHLTVWKALRGAGFCFDLVLGFLKQYLLNPDRPLSSLD